MTLSKVYGRRFRACGPACVDGFREDRRSGAIYSATLERNAQGQLTGRFWPVEAASLHFGHCAYCQAQVTNSPRINVNPSGDYRL